MPAGKPLTEKELKALPTGTIVHACYSHPDPTEPKLNGRVWVEQMPEKNGCWLHVGAKNSTFCMDYTYGEDGKTDESHCKSEGPDGDELEIFEYKKTGMQQKAPKKKRGK